MKNPGLPTQPNHKTQFPLKLSDYQLLKPISYSTTNRIYLAARGEPGFERLLAIKIAPPDLGLTLDHISFNKMEPLSRFPGN